VLLLHASAAAREAELPKVGLPGVAWRARPLLARIEAGRHDPLQQRSQVSEIYWVISHKHAPAMGAI
jgi:hypothetical protein